MAIGQSGSIMRVAALVISFLVPLASANAKIRTLPLPDLVAAAEHIVIAEVVAIAEDTVGPRVAPVRNDLQVTRVLKGSFDASKSFVLRTYYKPGQKAREDSVVLPAKGRSVLLFLRAARGAELVPVNGIQGVWPLEAGTGKTLGMGFRYSISEIETLIAAGRR